MDDITHRKYTVGKISIELLLQLLGGVSAPEIPDPYPEIGRLVRKIGAVDGE
jgi:hypothetical protein